jgi:hypothetical protein
MTADDLAAVPAWRLYREPQCIRYPPLLTHLI